MKKKMMINPLNIYNYGRKENKGYLRFYTKTDL